ncbi:MAG TPA: succinylglutamate desuccinylase [Rhodobacteraceae bacterium]|nr:succinylglutamate desuccinylase [Paracoccaceae bacterium]
MRVAPGSRQTIDLPVSVLSDHTPVTMSVHVVHGRRPGPTLFVSAAIHGDEVIGVEIARRLLRAPQLDAIRGTLLVVPIVNAFGFLNHARYLPDRRDLNRSFPGREHGSLASRLAHLFMREIVLRSDFGIDLHSAAVHRTNMPQIRVSPAADKTLDHAEAFGAPVVILAKLRDGSLRKAAQERGVDILLFEAGEGLRFDELSARAGLAGILRVMNAMGMIPRKGIARAREKPLRAMSSVWQRAPAGGLMRGFKGTGEYVEAGDLLGQICDPFGETEIDVVSETTGVIVGRTNLPIVNEGDALFHIAETRRSDAEDKIDALARQLQGDPMFDEDEII